MRQQYAWRSKLLAVALTIAAFLIAAQIVRIQNSEEAAQFKLQASNYATQLMTFYPDRGEIYDRSGHLLAGNKTVYEIGVDLASVKDANAIAMAASTQLGLDYNILLQQITQPAPGLSYVVLADYVDSAQAAVLQQMKATM